MKQKIWVVEINRNKGWFPQYVFLLRTNARHKANEIRKTGKEWGYKIRVSGYVPFIPLKAEFKEFVLAIARESTAKSPQNGSRSSASSWPSYQLTDLAGQAKS